MSEDGVGQPDGHIIARDMFGREHPRPRANLKFRVSVYGLLVEDGRLLVQRHPKLKQFGLPGGGMELGETIAETLNREFQEETGLSVAPLSLLTVSEAFFTFDDGDFHSLMLFYRVRATGGELREGGYLDEVAEARFIDLSTTDDTIHYVFRDAVRLLRQTWSNPT